MRVPSRQTVANLAKMHLTRKTAFLNRFARDFQALSFYGAIGITGFGWALSRLLFFDCKNYAPLWFCAALFIYNLDRLKPDNADAINIPRRNRTSAALRKTELTITVAAAVTLVVLPLIRRDCLMLLLTLGGAAVCINYPLAPLGFRLKNIPLLKTFFAPTLVAAAFLVPPLLQQRLDFRTPYFFTATAWTWCVLFFNMMICDLRDISGDARSGVHSLPVLLGARRTMQALVTILVIITILSVATFLNSPSVCKPAWRLLSAAIPVFLAALLTALRRPQPESFYEWWVEGILLVPPVAVALLG